MLIASRETNQNLICTSSIGGVIFIELPAKAEWLVYAPHSQIQLSAHTVYLCVLYGSRNKPIISLYNINPLNAELNPIYYLLALLGAHHFLHVSRIRVKSLTLRLLTSYIYMTLVA